MKRRRKSNSEVLYLGHVLSFDHRSEGGIDSTAAEILGDLQHSLGNHLHALLAHLEGLHHYLVLLIDRHCDRREGSVCHSLRGFELLLRGEEDLEAGEVEPLQ